MAGHCIFLIIFTLYVIQQLHLILAAPSKHQISAVNYQNKINEYDNDNDNENKKLKSNENQLIYNSYEIDDNHKIHKRRTKRHTVNACGRLNGPVQAMSIASHRKLAMHSYYDLIDESRTELLNKHINADNFEKYITHEHRYEYLEIADKNIEPKFSDWHINMQKYTHTFEYLYKHHQHIHIKHPHTYEPELTNILFELKIVSQKLVCELQSMALHLEEKPTLKLLTSEEKESIENNLITNKHSRYIHEIDINYAKKFYFDNIIAMQNSLKHCMNDCNCVKGNGQC